MCKREKKTVYFYGINKFGDRLEDGDATIIIDAGDSIDMDYVRDSVIESLYDEGVRNIVITGIK